MSRKEEIKMKISKLASALAFGLGAAIVVTGASVSAQPASSTVIVNVSKSNERIQLWGLPGHQVVLENQDGLDHALEFFNSSDLVYETTTLSKGCRPPRANAPQSPFAKARACADQAAQASLSRPRP